MRKQKKKKSFSFNRLFYNNKFVLVISLLFSIILWAIMVSMNTQEHPRAITDVPIVLNLSDAAQADGMKVFSPVDAKATVYITGNSLVVNQVKAEDMQVVAPNITAAGTYTVTLSDQSVQKLGNLTDYQVRSIAPSQVVISVDQYKEKTFTIQNDINYRQGYQADPSYFVGVPTLSSDTVTISGPEKLVQQVNRVAYEYQVNDTLRESKQFTANLVMYDANGNKITDSEIKMNPGKVDVTLPVLPRKVLPLSAAFVNKPDGLTFKTGQIQISPKSIEIAAPPDVMQGLKEIALDPIDFSRVSPSNTSFEVGIDLPSNCKNLSNTPTAKVTLNVSGLTTRSMTVSNFNVQNLDSDKSATVYTKNLPVTIVGPESEITNLTGNDIIGNVNLSGNKNFIGQTEVPVTFSISGTSSSWVYGSYTVDVGIASK